MSEGRDLPNSPEAERAVLGSMLLDPNSTIDRVMGILDPTGQDLQDERNRVVFRAAVGLFQARAAVDLLTVKEALSRNGGLDAAGGITYLAALTGGVPDTGNVEHYARIVKEKSVLRRLIRAGENITQGALVQEKDVETLLAGAAAEIRTIEQAAQRAAIAAEAGVPGIPPSHWLDPAQVLAASPLPKARFPTGVPALDRASRGGFPTGAIVTFQGEPDAGKTALALQIILKVAREHDVVAVLFTPDGGRDMAAARLGSMIGLDAERLEQREPAEVARLAEILSGRRIFLPDHAREEVTLERVLADAEFLWPELPHLYVVDSLQEVRAAEGSEEKDERARVNETMRLLQKAVMGPVPALAIACSQTTKAAFASRKPQDRTRPIAAGAESGKIAFLSSALIHLDGDPSKGPDYGRAQVAKSKFGGEKPTFSLRLDRATGRLEEIDSVEVARGKEQSEAREREKVSSKLSEEVLATLTQHGPLNVTHLHERVTGRRADLLTALNGLEAQQAAVWKRGPKNSRIWEAVRGPVVP